MGVAAVAVTKLKVFGAHETETRAVSFRCFIDRADLPSLGLCVAGGR
jgi:hypothetical protein